MIKTLFFLISFFILTVNRASEQNSDVLTLSLYPYVPDIERFKSAITEEWGRHHPDIRLEYSAWDCYSGTLPENVDVFVYDSIYFDKYLKQGFAFVCAFSGGKDSLVLLDLTAKALAPSDFYVVFSKSICKLFN